MGGKIRISAVFCGLIVTLCASLGAFAAPAPDTTIPCSLDIIMKTSAGAAVPGGRITLYRVASGHQNAGAWELTDEYQNCGISKDALDTAEAANELAAYTKSRALAGDEACINNRGKVCFGELSAGLYLVMQTEAAPGYLAAEPFLLALPDFSAAENRYIYSVTSYPKIGAHTVDTGNTPDDKTPENIPDRLPQTGQLWWPVPVLAAGGVLFLILSGVVKKRHE